MLPNNEVRVPQPRLASEDLVSQDITERFTEAASSELNPRSLLLRVRLFFASH